MIIRKKNKKAVVSHSQHYVHAQTNIMLSQGKKAQK